MKKSSFLFALLMSSLLFAELDLPRSTFELSELEDAKAQALEKWKNNHVYLHR